eukprot:6266611-Alexandrium_andersonii.AAC.1
MQTSRATHSGTSASSATSPALPSVVFPIGCSGKVPLACANSFGKKRRKLRIWPTNFWWTTSWLQALRGSSCST